METKIRKTVSLMAEAHWTLEEVQCSAFNAGPVQIVISNMPTDNVTLGHLEFFLEQHCGMPDDGSCGLELQKDGSALVSFTSNPKKTGMLCVQGNAFLLHVADFLFALLLYAVYLTCWDSALSSSYCCMI